jgi:hypothetical protein
VLAIRTVFLDTSAFVSANFEYAGPVFDALAKLIADGHAKCLITPIIVGEVESNIRERVDAINVATERFRQKHPIAKNFRSLTLKPYGSTFDAASAAQELIGQFREFLERVHIEVITLERASNSDVFRWYFEKQPPFGPGKKKHEFPDAFNIAVLEAWCKTNEEKVYVVSDDGDLADYCSASTNLIRLKRPSEFVDASLRQFAITKAIEDSVGDHHEMIKAAIRSQFEALGFYLDDEDGDVDDVTVQEVKIEEVSLVNATAGIGLLEVSVQIEYIATASYDDMETAIWDSEDKVSIPTQTRVAKLEDTLDTIVLVSIEIEAEERLTSVTKVKFESTNIPISVNRYDDYR